VRNSIFGCLCLLVAVAHGAERAYVTDRLEVQMRSGGSLQHKILKMVPSGTGLTVLEEDGASGYTHVALDSGDEGWILSRYLTSQPVARSQMDEYTRKFNSLQEENKTLKDELAALRAGKDAADKTAQESTGEANRLNTELIAIRQASANAIQIQAERDQLQETVINLQRDLESLRREKHAQEADIRQNWFLIGASVLFGGMLLGLILPRLSWRKRSSWDSF
jgi:SH3 domain protein